MIREYKGAVPKIEERTFIAENSVIIGNVEIGRESSVWYNAVIRADADTVKIGEGCSIQDNVVIHVDTGFPCTIGDNVTVGHTAIVHGCTIGNNVLVGMGSIIMNKAVIGDNSIIGAGAVVTGGTVIPEGSVVMGAPAKVVKQVTEKHLEQIKTSAEHYVHLASQFAEWDK